MKVNTALHLKSNFILICIFILNIHFLRWNSKIFAGNNNLDAQQTIEYYNNLFSDLYSKQADWETENVKQQLELYVSELFDTDRLARQILQKKWQNLNDYEHAVFMTAIQKSICNFLVKTILTNSTDSMLEFKLESSDIKENFSKLHYSYESINGRRDLTVFMVKNAAGKWKIVNLQTKTQNLMRFYYSFCNDILEDYSFNYLLGELIDEGYIVLEDFEFSEVGQLPTGWTWKSNDDKKNKPYEIKFENGNKYLAADDVGESVILGKDIQWNINKYPFISFKWRGRQIPVAGDERYGETNDSAAGIYFIYKKKLGLIPESVKYVWSTTLPVGSAVRRSGTGRPWMVVAESGHANLGEWRTYVFNLKEAYKKTFGSDPPDKLIGIGLLSDANSSRSKAYADYDDILALKQANGDSGIKQYLDAE